MLEYWDHELTLAYMLILINARKYQQLHTMDLIVLYILKQTIICFNSLPSRFDLSCN